MTSQKEIEQLAGFIAMEMGEKGASCEQIADLVLRLGYRKHPPAEAIPEYLKPKAKDSQSMKDFKWLLSIRLFVKNGYMGDEDAWRIQEYFAKQIAKPADGKALDKDKLAMLINGILFTDYKVQEKGLPGGIGEHIAYHICATLEP